MEAIGIAVSPWASITEVTITKTTISNNRGPWGGGIFNAGTLTLTASSVVANTGNYGGIEFDYSGGGIYNTTRGTVTIHGGAITGNIPDDCVGC